jgi:hypothetical protein
MWSYDSVHTGKHTAKIVNIEISNNVRFGRYIADVFKPVYKVGENTVRDNGVFRYKQVNGFLYDPKKNWGYAKFLSSMGVRKNNAVDERFKFENLIGELVEIEVYDKVFNNEFSKRVNYPVAKVLRILEIPF